MLTEQEIRNMIEVELSALEKLAAMENANIYQTRILEADRHIQKISILYQVLDEEFSDDVAYVVNYLKDKLQEM